MSAYKNLIREFPGRCSDLLKAYPAGKGTDRDVTQLLAIASAGITIPFERLTKKTYPYLFDDYANNPNTSIQFDKRLTSKFLHSDLLSAPERWYCGSLESVKGEPDTWPELRNPRALPNAKTVYDIVRQMANALAHGGILTKGDPISQVIFIARKSRRSEEINYLMVPPDEFLIFLKKWFQFLEELHFDN